MATRILAHADDAGCHKNQCSILVNNFILHDRNTSRYGMQLAAELSHLLAVQEPTITVIEQSRFDNLLQRERFPSKTMSEDVMRDIARDLSATAVLVGTTKRLDEYTVEVSARLLGVENNKAERRAEVKLFAPAQFTDLTPVEAFRVLPPITSTVDGRSVYQSGANGVSHPQCYYMPNPSYSEAARKAQINGTLLLEAIVDTDGGLENVRIVRGLPGS